MSCARSKTGTFTSENDGGNKVERDDVDALVYYYGGQAVNGLAADLKGRVKELYNVGDGYAPRSLHRAINEAHKYAR